RAGEPGRRPPRRRRAPRLPRARRGAGVTAGAAAGAPLDRRAVAEAGHTGDEARARRALAEPDPGLRATALGALDRMGRLGHDDLAAALGDPSPEVRRRACELVARRPGDEAPSLLAALADEDPSVVEVAAWAS